MEAILRIVTLVQSVNSYDSLKLDLDLARLSGARMIISWLASLEIILCAVFVVIKSSALEINSRVSCGLASFVIIIDTTHLFIQLLTRLL